MTVRVRASRFTVHLVASREPVLSVTADDVDDAEEEAALLLGLTTRALFARELGPVRATGRRRKPAAPRRLTST